MALLVNYNGPKTQNDYQLLLQQNQRSTAYDPVDKLRVSSPQALIDTDFEYGVQPTKWESLSLQNSRSGAFYIPSAPIPINSIVGSTTSRAVTVTFNGIQLTGTGAFTNSSTTITVTTTNAHGLTVGIPILVTGLTATTNPPNGTYTVATIPSSTTFTYIVASAPTGTIVNTAGSVNLFFALSYPQPNSAVYIQNSLSNACNGWFYIDSVSGATFTYRASAIVGSTANQYNLNTYGFQGYFYNNAGIALSSTSAFANTTLSSVSVNASAVFSCSGYQDLLIGSELVISGAAGGTGTITSYSNPTKYFVLTCTPTLLGTTFTISATQGGSSVAVTAGTLTMTFTASNVTCTTASAHGLSAGSYVYVTGTLVSSGSGAPNGAWIVQTTTAANAFTFGAMTVAVLTAGGAPTSISNTANNLTVYARPSGYVETRPFDGGVAFSAGAAVPNQQLIRQTRRYFRYQSGKGIQFSTGSVMKPSIFNTSLISNGTAIGSTITVTTRYIHNLAVGCVIQVVGADQAGFNGTFTIVSTPSATTFTYVNTVVLSTTTATGTIIKIVPISWYGSSIRLGLFDQQNGMFFEFDGQTLYAVWRSSVNQLSGVITATQYSANIVGSGTQFTTQLAPGDFIVIRGQSYRVTGITSDTAMTISPEYRGSSITSPKGAIISKTIDTRVPQSSWFDPCDGTGPSGFTLDLTRMQMWYIDYSWYGAGVIRWGFRTTGGAIIYVYTQQNNNARYEAYMRSGNLPAHYESSGLSPTTYLTATAAAVDTTLTVNSTSGFANSGNLKLTTSGASGVTEYISYTGKTTTTLTGVTRAVYGGSATAQTFTVTSPQAIYQIVEYAAPDTAASISHWGSSVIMDGRFDDDKSLIFNYGSTSPVTIAQNASVPILAVRIAPSADSGQTGLLGDKEIINRMQLQLVELGVVTNGTFLISLIINGFVAGFGGQFSSINSGSQTSSSLAQIAVNTSGTAAITGGESIAAAYSNSSGQTTLDLTRVRDVGNSILGGGTTNVLSTTFNGFYPDGPDILYVVATNIDSASKTILARLSWTEAQA
jgi:hypothetical protein